MTRRNRPRTSRQWLIHGKLQQYTAIAVTITTVKTSTPTLNATACKNFNDSITVPSKGRQFTLLLFCHFVKAKKHDLNASGLQIMAQKCGTPVWIGYACRKTGQKLAPAPAIRKCYVPVHKAGVCSAGALKAAQLDGTQLRTHSTYLRHMNKSHAYCGSRMSPTLRYCRMHNQQSRPRSTNCV